MRLAERATIACPLARVWSVFSDVERWPEWTASIDAVRYVEGTSLAVGAAVEIRQPRLPRMIWRVTELDEGRSWSWVARSPGAVTVARHALRAVDASCTVAEQEIEQSGLLGRPVGLLLAGLTRRYLAMEGAGLKRRCEDGMRSAGSAVHDDA